MRYITLLSVLGLILSYQNCSSGHEHTFVANSFSISSAYEYSKKPEYFYDVQVVGEEEVRYDTESASSDDLINTTDSVSPMNPNTESLSSYEGDIGWEYRFAISIVKINNPNQPLQVVAEIVDDQGRPVCARQSFSNVSRSANHLIYDDCVTPTRQGTLKMRLWAAPEGENLKELYTKRFTIL